MVHPLNTGSYNDTDLIHEARSSSQAPCCKHTAAIPLGPVCGSSRHGAVGLKFKVGAPSRSTWSALLTSSVCYGVQSPASCRSRERSRALLLLKSGMKLLQ
jgi:hypothetical protein